MTPRQQTIDTQISLESVSDASTMRPILERALTERFQKSLSIAHLSVPRVYARESGVAHIQYILEMVTSEPERTERVMLYGEYGNSTGADSGSHSTTKSLYIKELQLILHLFPFDDRLAGLSGCVVENSGDLWFRWRDFEVPDTGLTFSPEEILAYRFGKRCVLSGVFRASAESGSAPVAAVMKLARSRQTAQTLVRQDLLQELFGEPQHDCFSFPKNLFADISRGVIITEAVSSPTLYETLSSEEGNVDVFISAVQRVGVALRNLHVTSVPSEVPLTRYLATDETEMLKTNITRTIAVAPTMRSVLKDTMVDDNPFPMSDSENSSVLSHRDFYDKQLFVTEDRITLIDLDTVTLADPMLDVANFLAHLNLRRRQGLLSEQECCAAKSRFLTGYFGNLAAIEGEQMTSLRWWYNMSLIRLATLYALRPKWRRLPEVLIADCRKEGFSH